MKHYSNEEQIRDVVEGFETCSTPKDQFTHREHLTVATWYLGHSTSTEALDQMRHGLLRFLDHHGVGRAKYKEQLTVSWMKLIERSIQQMPSGMSPVDQANAVLDQLGDSSIVTPEGATSK